MSNGTREGYGYGADAAKVSQRGPFHMEMGDRLARLTSIANETTGALGALRERLLGPWAEPVSRGERAGPSPGKLSATEAALFAADEIIECMVRAREHVEALQGGL